MSIFKKDNQTAIVSRLWYTTDWGYKKSTYSATGNSYVWHLKALTLKDGIEIENFWKEFLFHTSYNADIKESDRLTIDWVDYDVKGISKFKWVSFDRLQCVVELC